jgi:hypothetical protein
MAAKVALDQLDTLDDAGKNALGDIMNDLEEVSPFFCAL